MTKKYRHLLFDLDGTLTDPMEGITRSVQHALRHFGIEVSDLRELCPFIDRRSRSPSGHFTASTTARPAKP